MLHRAMQAFTTCEKSLAEPTDLPNVVREDLLMLAPVNPRSLYATWYISYSTQNRLRDFIGEEGFDDCRLVLVLKLLASDSPGLTVDVSGPTTNAYIALENLASRRDKYGKLMDNTMIYGELNYQDEDTSYYITRSEVITLPRLYLSESITPGWAPREEFYERIYRRLDPQVVATRDSINLMKLGEQFDSHIGVLAPPSGY